MKSNSEFVYQIAFTVPMSYWDMVSILDWFEDRFGSRWLPLDKYNSTAIWFFNENIVHKRIEILFKDKEKWAESVLVWSSHPHYIDV